jgi:SAM-dependent methyltransferase
VVVNGIRDQTLTLVEEPRSLRGNHEPPRRGFELMGIAKGGASLLYELKRDHGLGGAVLQLGKQSLYVEADQLPGIASQFGFEVDVSHITKDHEGEYLPDTYGDVVLFKMLGFDNVKSLDFSAYQGADIIHDLNEPVPSSLKGGFDFVYDGGTLEHIFDFPQCLQNIHDILRVGGMIAHASPSHNHVDHGFYMYSPTVFWDYYHANNYRIIKSYIFEYETQHTAYTAKDWLIYNYEPEAIENLVAGGWGRKSLGIWFVAQKLHDSTSNVIPQQGAYRASWSGTSTYNPYQRAQAESTFLKFLKRALRSLPIFGPFLTWLSTAIRTFQNGHMSQSRPPLIARY